MVLLRAADLGLRGDETPAELDANTALLGRLEALRLEAGQRMGMGDVTHSVLPKPVIVSPGTSPGSVVSR
jgi:2-methylaconitate cis-trans-isomerase PrpF